MDWRERVGPAMGWIEEEATFRLRAPGARFVEIVFRDHPDGEQQSVRPMDKLEIPGPNERPIEVFEATMLPPLPCYRYRVQYADRTEEVADPWSRHVVRKNVPGMPAWSVCAREAVFDWQSDTGVRLAMEDAIILECHVGDMSAHPSSGTIAPGTLAGFCETHPAAEGGLAHVVRMGFSAVELMPLASWPVREEGERLNHWGYMPSFPLAPTHRYTRAFQTAEEGAWIGMRADGSIQDPAIQLKHTIRLLHERGIAVIVDVVLNHVSIHDPQPLRHLDPGSWFRRKADGMLENASGCGNDIASEDPDMRALLVHTIARWFEDFHVDGVRLDLGELHDDETLSLMAQAARDIRPDALLIAEPWSLRGHRAKRIAALGWTVWNDGFRKRIKGDDHGRGNGFAFGGTARGGMDTALTGSVTAHGGPFGTPDRSLNYLASHDGYSLGDYVRLALGTGREEIVTRDDAVLAVRGRALGIHKLLTACLLAARGPVMLHAGQSFARARIEGGREGQLSRNPWDRADETSWIDWTDRARNPELVAWVHRWITLRKAVLLPAWAAHAEQRFLAGDRDDAIGYTLAGGGHPCAVLLNADPHQAAVFQLPPGKWTPLVGHGSVRLAEGAAKLAPSGACLLAAEDAL